ncbi:DNA polymerase IV [Mariprofundus erugo]|uniref:DNA polymerase IV n=1 Tax=Mariprofundus erugo TaxID=2528639 RepID=A0A5R9GJ33_9PROT|nr:DNA polymerase IV [Mariprofundus erugo]TLS66676.1 DNA polymerase IV [Mariprofundus erugo]
MKDSDWSNVIAHVDCDAFYASCELVRYPQLKGRPVCVLSSHHAIVVAKSYDARALGITTGMPVWEARKIAPQAAFLAADFRYYGLMSGKVFSILRRYSPEIEIYSIDEGFLDMNGVRSLWRRSFLQLADDIRLAIRSETGLTASVGIAPTRTLAKMASEANKPDGILVLPASHIDRFLYHQAVAAIPGMGRNRTALLRTLHIHTASQFACMDEALIRQLLGRQGVTLKYELNGHPVLPLETIPSLPQSIARTASMGEVSGQRSLLAAHLSWHATRLVSELVAKSLLAQRIDIFLTLASGETNRVDMVLEVPSNSLKRIMGVVKEGLMRLFRAGERYRGCGVVATRISQQRSATADLFGLMQADCRQTTLMQTVNQINRKYGDRTLSLARVQGIRPRQVLPRFCYPLLIAR